MPFLYPDSTRIFSTALSIRVVHVKSKDFLQTIPPNAQLQSFSPREVESGFTFEHRKGGEKVKTQHFSLIKDIKLKMGPNCPFEITQIFV